MDDDTTSAHRRVLEEAFAAAGRADAEGQLTHYCDDAVLEVMTLDPPLRVEGRDRLRPMLQRAYELNELALVIDDVVACRDPDQLVIESHATGRARATGEPFVKDYITRFWFRDGRIARHREWVMTRTTPTPTEEDGDGR